MARKSQWAQFAENFKSTYDITRQVQQGYATKQVMDDEKFMSEDGGAGYGLKGDNLERARYKALGDIATKYGDAAGGLANRTALADLNAKDRDNRIDANNEQYTTALRGLIAQNAALANIRNTDSDTGLNKANTAGVLAMTPERVAAMRADTSESGARTEKLTAETVALGLKNDSTLVQQPTADAAAISSFELLLAQNNGDLANIDLRDQANEEAFKAAIFDARAKGEASQLAELQSVGFLDYANRFNAGEFKTGKEATEAYVNVVAAFDPDKATDLMKKYTEKEISQIANQGLEFQATVTGLVQKNDFEGIRAFFDEQNGDATGVTLDIDAETGAIKMFQTGPEGEIIPIMDAANATEAKAQFESVATYGNAASYAESLFSRRRDEAGLGKVAAETAVLNAQAANLGSEGDVNKKQIEKMNAEIAKINNQVENSDQADSETVRQEGLQRFLGGDTYAYMQADDPEGAKTLLQTFKYQTGMLNMAALKEGGVSMEAFLNMTPEDQRQFE